MTEDLFNSLALKVIAEEATAEEKQALDQLLASNPALSGEYNELRETFSILKASQPLADESPEMVSFPSYRVQELRSAVRKQFPKPKERTAPWWKMKRALAFSYAGCSLAVFLLLVGIVNHRSGVEFGTYEDSEMRNGQASGKMEGVEVRSFATDRGFEHWRESRLGARFRIWFDEAQDLIVVVQPGGLFSQNKVSTYPLPEDSAERGEKVKAILEGLVQDKN